MMLADVLGTVWWTALMAGGGFVLGVLLSSYIKALLEK